MGSSYNNLIILTLIFNLFIIFTKADQANMNVQLINQLCGVTDAPEFCKSCVKYGRKPNEKNIVQDDVAIVLGMLHCANLASARLEEQMSKLLKYDHNADINTRNVISQCSPLLRGVYKDGMRVIYNNVVIRKFTEAKGAIDNLIKPRLNQCREIINKSGKQLPPLISSGISAVEGDYKIIYQILAAAKPYSNINNKRKIL